MNHKQSSPQNTEQSAPRLPRWLWSAVAGLLLLGGGVWLLLVQITAVNQPVRGAAYARQDALPGQPAPNFELADLNGKPLQLSDFKGRPVVLNFWATWCGPCREEFPELQAAAVEFGDRLTILGINHTSADSPALIPDFVADYDITFPILLDELGLVVEVYGVVGLPTTIFIDRNGVIRDIITGPVDKALIERKLSEL